MLLLISYVLVALVFSFLCSVAEAVLLSVTSGHIALLEQEQRAAGRLLRKLKDDINKPLAAILTLNTIAHTIGAAGAGAQAAAVFGNHYVGIASAILTLLILVFSEIIPKTLGAHYWRQLASPTAYSLRLLVWLLYPFVKLSELLTRGMTEQPPLKGFSRKEFVAMAALSAHEQQLEEREALILQNLFLLRETRLRDAMTPRPVVITVPEEISVDTFYREHNNGRFSRLPLYRHDKENITGFVLRSDILAAYAQGQLSRPISDFRRDIPVLLASMSLSQAFDECMLARAHILLVVDEYGGMEGILTLEDLIESLLGWEIVDESDKSTDMQKLARRLWRRRADKLGLALDDQ